MPKVADPQFLYMILILPTLFGLTLVGEGLNKILKSETQGWLSIVFGVVFISVVVLAYMLFVRGAVPGITETSGVVPTAIPTLGF